MNFFGVEISDAQFLAAMETARNNFDAENSWFLTEGEIRKSLGFESGDVAAPPAGGHHGTVGLHSYLNPWWP